MRMIRFALMIFLLTTFCGCRTLPRIEVAVNCGPGKPTVTVAVGETQKQGSQLSPAAIEQWTQSK